MNEKPYSQEHVDSVLKQVCAEAAGLADFILREIDPRYVADKSITREEIVEASSKIIEKTLREVWAPKDLERMVRSFEKRHSKKL